VHDSGPFDKADEGSLPAGEVSQEIWADLDGTPAPISACERSELLDATVRRGPMAIAPDAGEDVSAHQGTAPAFPMPTSLSLPVDLPALLRMLEESYIRLALEQSGGNKKEAARLLGLGRTTLVEKLRRRAADVSAP
jgi:DNA-binding NtrC family response regulator